ncbi:MAG: thioesterase superfamily protein [Thermoleophilia bacterium]|nr:thioesterase superfamily protein [Thermoleophilia bacterium]
MNASPDTCSLDELHAMRSLAPLPGDPRPGTRDLAATALGALGVELLECAPQRVVARMPLRGPRDAGALLVLAETVASTAAGLAAGPGRRAFGAELDASFLERPVAGLVLAIAEPLVVDQARHTWRIRVVDPRGTLVLEGRCTLGVVESPTGD